MLIIRYENRYEIILTSLPQTLNLAMLNAGTSVIVMLVVLKMLGIWPFRVGR